MFPLLVILLGTQLCTALSIPSGRQNPGNIEGSGNVYVDELLKIVNDVITSNIPSNEKLRDFASAELDKLQPGSEINECTLIVNNPFERVKDSWIQLEYKTLVFTAKIDITPINIKCKGFAKVKVGMFPIYPDFIAGLDIGRLTISLKANMTLDLCFKPEIEDMKIQGKVEPIIKLADGWQVAGFLAGTVTDYLDDKIEELKKTILEEFEKLKTGGPDKLQTMMTDLDPFCIDDSLDNLGEQASSTLHDLLETYNLN